MMRKNFEKLSPYSEPDALLEALYSLEGPVAELRDTLMKLLEHEDPDVRAEVIRVIIRRWKDAEARPLAFQLLRNDDDVEVRAAAAYAIAGSGSDCSRDQDTRALRGALRDESEALSVRAAAYDSLLIIHRKASFPTKTRHFDPANDVDWGWVDSLAPREDEF